MSAEYVSELYNDGMHETFNEDDISRQRTKNAGKRRYYPSNKAQTFIKNAVNGSEYEWRVGSKEEQGLFKTVDATGTCDSKGYVIKNQSVLPNPNPNHLYYDSPEQCMRHLNVTYSNDFIEKWRSVTQFHTPQN